MQKSNAWTWQLLVGFLFAGFICYSFGWKFYLVYGLTGSLALHFIDFTMMQFRIKEHLRLINPNVTINKPKLSWYISCFLTLALFWPTSFVSYLLWRKQISHEIEED